MSVDPASPRSRRAMLAGTLGAVAAVAAQAIGRPLPANAGGQALVLGQSNLSDAVYTSIGRTDRDAYVAFIGPSYGVSAVTRARNGVALDGATGSANGAMGVIGRTGGHHSQVAVLGDTTSGNTEGIAVKAVTGNGIGVYAECTGGAAIIAKGLTEFSRSGKADFVPGQASRTLTAGRITTDTLVVATVQGAVAGVWVLGVHVNVAKQQFTIKLNKPAPKALKVGWFVVN
jgi:hypothetical protein